MDIKSISKITKNISGLKPPLLLWLRVFLWCGVIFALSARPNYQGNDLDLETFLSILEFFSRKFCHVAEYAVLMVFTYRAVKGSSEGPIPGHLILSFLFVLLYSFSDEWHQTFVFGRSGTLFDVFVDSLGSASGYFYCIWRDRKTRDVTT